MNPESVQKLLSLSEGKELVVFIDSEIDKLNRLPEIDGPDVALEVRSRKKAVGVLREILKPFTFIQENVIIKDKKGEYDM